MSEAPNTPDLPAKSGFRQLAMLLPLLIFLAIAGFLFAGLELKPRDIPSALIGKPVPEFDLPAIPKRPPGLKTADLKGQVWLVNVFASWCVSCRVEHPLLMQLAKTGDVPVHGLNYKDEPAAALAWLKRFGDPYKRVGMDVKGRTGIDFGVYGVPETFVINAEGKIICKHIGPLNRSVDKKSGKVTYDDLRDKILPAVQAARQGKPVKC